MGDEENLIIFEDDEDQNWWRRAGLAIKIPLVAFAISLLPLGYYAFASPAVPSCHVQPGAESTAGAAPANWFSRLL